MSEFPTLEYSIKDVERAGKALATKLIWNPESAEDIYRVFAIANNWRDSHALPMNRMRAEMIARIRTHNLAGITAARLKRMPSIRRKLRVLPVPLNKLQDLGGCRAILSSISDVNTFIERFKDSSKHTFHNQSDYITKPKPDGYRCHHLIYRFVPKTDADIPFQGRRIEMQIRTRLQHSWATAVEAVGLFRREDLKAGQGSPEWLRLFALMSAEFAIAENCPEGEHAPPRRQRVQEIKALERELSAVPTLENLRQIVRFTDTYRFGDGYKPQYYLIKYDNVARTVEVEVYSEATAGAISYDKSEQPKAGDTIDKRVNTVLVEVDDIENLKATYPNYFGDVFMFNKNLKDITLGRDAKEYTMPPQQTVPPPPREAPDMSWFRKPKRWR